jgi:hypothetical protein
MTSSILILSYFIRICEAPLDVYQFMKNESVNVNMNEGERNDERPKGFFSLLNCVYYTVVTMSTVGYGDLSP